MLILVVKVLGGAVVITGVVALAIAGWLRVVVPPEDIGDDTDQA